MFTGKTVFAQLMSLIPRRDFNACVARYKGDYRSRNLSCYDQFLVMCLAQYASKNSLRDIEASLIAVEHKLYHSGINYAVPRNTLAKANEQRDWRIYRDFGQALIKRVRPLYAEDPFRLDIDNMVYAFDSSTISLCLKLCPWAKFRTTKAGIKMHTLLDLRGNLPVYIHLTDASVHDVKALDTLCVEMGAIYLLDKGYVDFFRLFNHIHMNGAFFVTRAKDNMLYEVVESKGSDPEAGIISDEIIKLTGIKPSKCYPETLRMVIYEDFATGLPLPYQPFGIRSSDDRSTLQRALERRTVLQMDKATSSYQVILWHLGKCRLYSNLDCSMLVPHSGTCQEKVGARAIIVYNFSNVRLCVI